MVAVDLFKRPLVLICTGLILGILAFDYKIMLLISGCIFLLLIILSRTKNDKLLLFRRIVLSFFLILFIFGFYLNFKIRSIKTLDQIFDTNPSGIICYGNIYKSELSNKKYEFYINVDSLVYEEKSYYSAFDIIVVFDLEKMDLSTLEKYSIGDSIKVKGTLYPCVLPRNPGQFNEKKYYLAKGITAKLYASDIECISTSDNLYNQFKTKLNKISNQLRKNLFILYPEKEAGLLSAMLLGERGDVDSELKSLYSDIGIAHILSISGLHISLLGIGLFNFLLFITKRLKFSVYVTLAFMLSFGLMTGFAVSTKRAIIMLFCMLIARIIFKSYDGQSAGALAAIIILVVNPLELYDTGFQLSFVAVFSIFAGNEIINRLKITNRIVRYLTPVVFAQLGTYPVILYNYYSINLLSIPANLIMIPMMSIVLISGLFSCGILTFGLFTISKIIAGPAYYILQFYEAFSKGLSEIKNTNIITGCPSLLHILLYYSLFFGIVCMTGYVGKYIEFSKRNKSDKTSNKLNMEMKKCTFVISILAIVGVAFVGIFISLLSNNPYSAEYCNFLDVGQGNCISIKVSGKNILYDGGSANITHVGKYRIIPYLKYMGVKNLDYIFVSHTDEDHISGIKEIIEENKIKIGKLFLSVKTPRNDSFFSFCLEHEVDVEFVAEGDLFEFGEVIAPNEYINYKDVNAASIVLLMKLNDTSILLTGDSDMFSEAIYLNNIKSEVDVLQVAHHGSKYSTSKELLANISPRLAIISCSKRNSYGHPSPELIDRLENNDCDILKTFESGMISVIDKNDGFYVDRYVEEFDRVLDR